MDVRIERDGAASTPYGVVRRDDAMWQASYRLREGDRVIQTSQPRPRPDQDLVGRRSDQGVSPLFAYLQMPEDHGAPLKALALEVVGSESDPWVRARLLERWLRSDAFVYSLAPKALDPKQPILDFIQRVRQGHCECYATSLVLMLRALGHPARYARGFWGGDRSSEARNSILFRLTHYHAWAEIYLEGAGWIPLNPTPPDRRAIDQDTHSVEAGRAHRGDWLSLQADRFGRWWRERMRALAGWFLGSGWHWSALRLLVVGGWLALLAGVIRRRRGRRPRGAQARTRSAYGQAIRMLRRRGVRRRTAMTPRELEHAAVQRYPVLARPMRWLTAHFERFRYGGQAMPNADEALTELARGLKK